jgi:hypothetical protein
MIRTQNMRNNPTLKFQKACYAFHIFHLKFLHSINISPTPYIGWPECVNLLNSADIREE